MTLRTRTEFRCSTCGTCTPRWSGRCAGCDEWNTLVEQCRSRPEPGPPRPGSETGPRCLASIDPAGARPVSCGIGEFDRILSGGLVPGSVTLLSGAPGVGKSTLALQMALAMSSPPRSASVLYVAAEESATQVRRRAERLCAAAATSSVLLDSDVSVDAICSTIASREVSTVVVDSIQTVFDPSVNSGPGSVTQVRTCARRLAETARVEGVSCVLIGHVTKDGSVAGPRALEHLVDTVVAFDDEAPHGLRLMRATKHRYGPTGELGVFTMEGNGLQGVDDTAGMFLGDRRRAVPGSVVTPVMEGRRTLLAELQTLVGRRAGGAPKRVCQGVDGKRVDMVLAVLSRQTGIEGDVFASMVGGIQVREPGIDLALACAVVSAAMGIAVDPGTVVCGELSLAGEARRVPALHQRVREAARLGFTRAIVPQGTPDDVDGPGIAVCRVPDLDTALTTVLGSTVPVRVRHDQPLLGRPDHRDRLDDGRAAGRTTMQIV